MFQSGGWHDTIRQLAMELDRSLTYSNHFAVFHTRSITVWKLLENPVVLEYHQTVMGLGLHLKERYYNAHSVS
jgi:hypothetical protein